MWYTFSVRLNHHAKDAHEGIKKYPSDICRYTFANGRAQKFIGESTQRNNLAFAISLEK
jgi:hypothetical protein